MRSSFAVFLALACGLGLTACSEEVVVTTKQDFSAEREALKQKVAKQRAKKADGKTTVKTAKKKAKSAAAETVSFGSVSGFRYEAAGRRDPFRSFEWERPDRLVDDATRSPLERYDLAQLDVVAVVWETNNAKALVIDPSGQSYVVGQGARLGKNQGFVKAIKDNHVVVKETYVDHLGQKSTKDIEMRMRGSEGG